MREGQIEIFKNAAWLFADKIIRQGLNFLLTAYIARYLGVELFGIWSYALAFVVLFSFFSTLGIYNQLLRDFVRNPERHNELLGNAFVIKLLGGCITVALSYATIVITKPHEPFLHSLISLIAIGYIIQSFDVIDFFFQSQLKAKWIALSRVISFVIFGIIKVSLIHLQFPLLYFIWAQLGELLFSAMLLIFFFNKYFHGILNWSINWKSLRGMLKESLPIFFAEIAILIYMRIDQVMIGEMMGNEALGIFSAAVRLSELWYLVPGVICSTVFPSIIKSYAAADTLDYRKKLQRLYDLLMWLSIGIAMLVSMLAPLIVNVIYGPQFSSASSILVIHIWTSVFVFVGWACNQQLVLENLAKISFFRTVTGVVTNVVFNLILIPLWGANGAAVSTLIAHAFAWFSNYFFKASRQIFWINMRSLNIKRLITEYLHFK